MSDEQGQPARMPDPGTPFPILDSSEIELGYEPSAPKPLTLSKKVTGGSALVVGSYSVPQGGDGTKIANLTGVKAGFWTNPGASQAHALLFVAADTQDAFSTAEKHVTVSGLGFSGTNDTTLTFTVEGGGTKVAQIAAGDVQSFKDVWQAGGETGGAIFKAGFGMAPYFPGNVQDWRWQEVNSRKHVTLGLQLWP